MPITASNIEQKAKFVGNLVGSGSQSVQALERSNDAEALEALTSARKLVDEASRNLAAGKLDQAEDALNRAIELVTAHTRRISEGAVKSARAQQLYESRIASVKALADAFDRVSQEKGVRSTRGNNVRSSLNVMLAEIEAMAIRGNYEQAIVQLDQAYTSITAELSKLRDGDKLTKELHFASAEEEYIYEIDRNDSHVFLLKMTLSEKAPHPSFLPQIEAMRGEAEELRKQAEAQAGKKDFADAIKSLSESTDKLIRALRMGGAYIPG